MNSRGKARNKFWRRLYQGWHVAPTGMGVPTHGIGAKSNIGNLLPPDTVSSGGVVKRSMESFRWRGRGSVMDRNLGNPCVVKPGPGRSAGMRDGDREPKILMMSGERDAVALKWA